MNEYDPAGADGAYGLSPVVDEIPLGLQPELPDTQIYDVGPLPLEGAADEAGAADDEQPPIRRPVVYQRRPCLAAPVRGDLHRRHDRSGDDAGKPISGQWSASMSVTWSGRPSAARPV